MMYVLPQFFKSSMWCRVIDVRLGSRACLISPDRVLPRREGYTNVILRRKISSYEAQNLGPEHWPRMWTFKSLRIRCCESQAKGEWGGFVIIGSGKALGEPGSCHDFSFFFSLQNICYSGWFLFLTSQSSISFLILPNFTFLNCCHK